MNYGSRIVGTGAAHPPTEISNADLEKFLDTTDEWITTRTGIKTRYHVDRAKGESTMSLALEAAEKALQRADMKASEIDLIIVGTVTPDTVMPCTANQLQQRLGATKAFGFDLQAACSGWVYALSIADQYIRTGAVKTALVIGAETLSTIVNWKDRSTCVLFGDGAGATILQRTADDHRVIATKLYSDGNYGNLLKIEHGYGKVPTWSKEYREDKHKIEMLGSEIFKLAVRNMAEASTSILWENGFTSSDVNFFLFHQANIRIIDYCVKALGVEKHKTWINVDKYGNTSSATLPTALDEAWRANAVKSGDLVLMATFGGGLTWASALVRL